MDDSPAELEIEQSQYKCHIVSVNGLTIELAVEADLGEHIPETALKVNSWALLELLREKLKGVPPNDNRFLLSEKLFSGDLTGPFSNSKKPIYSRGSTPPNPSQAKAISSSLNSQLCVIWGPPGTGKTQTIAKAVEAHLNAGRRVLLVAHANTAVDEAMADVAEQLEQTGYYQEGKLIRLGICSERLSQRFPKVVLENIINEKSSELRVRREELQAELNEIEFLLAKHQERKALAKAIGKIEAEIKKKKDQIESLRAEIDHLTNMLDKLQSKLEQVQQAGFLKRAFFSFWLNPKKLEADLAEVSKSLSAKKEQESSLQFERKRLTAQLNEKKRELEKISQTLAQPTGNGSITALQAKKEELAGEIAAVNRELEQLTTKILAEASLIATTLTKTFSDRQFPDQPFDVLFVDEASMAPLPHLYWAVSKTRGYITIVGDFNQLPPVCISDDERAKKWLKRSIFEVLNIDDVEKARQDEKVCLLDTQYRMHPKIAAIPNELFYNNLLQNAPSTEKLILSDPLTSDTPLILVDTTSANPWCSRLNSGSRVNIFSALTAATIARRLQEETGVKKIGIVTPYRPQAKLISKIAQDWNLAETVRAETVHRFQGGEEEVIIFDCVEAPGGPDWSMLDDLKNGREARRLLNVALTRAKRKLIIVAHRKRLAKIIGKGAAIIKIIDLISQQGCEIPARKVVDSFAAGSFDYYAEKLIENQAFFSPAATSLYTEKNFWPAFFADLLKAKSSVHIYSPFISQQRASRLMLLLERLRHKNVEVRIVTRPPEKQKGHLAAHAHEACEYLEKIGAKVEYWEDMHQKIAVIDEAIVWEGSLNILSHKNSREQMRRLEGEKFAREVLSIFAPSHSPSSSLPEFCTACQEKGIKSPLIPRQSRYGEFYGCSRYPHCKYTFTPKKVKKRNRFS